MTKVRRKRDNFSNQNLLSRNNAFRFLLILVFLALLISLGTFLFLIDNDDNVPRTVLFKTFLAARRSDNINTTITSLEEEAPPPHLYPRLPHLPVFPIINNKEYLIHQTLYENKPTIAGIVAILYNFLENLHQSNQQLASSSTTTTVDNVRAAYFRLVQHHIMPLEAAYRGRSIFPRRNDNSIFISIAAFREYLLEDTLQSLFASAANPDKVFVGVIVNNCFGSRGGNEEEECKGGVKVVGKDKMGKDVLENVDGVADVNHIASFCSNDSAFVKYCDNGQIRVLYVSETEALGPAVARYYSSKLWGGETYYIQIDSHLHFATHWDELYIQDLKLAKSFPKAILSTYPPGFVNFRQEPPFTPGTRLCRCQLRHEEDFLPRVEMEGRCNENHTRPTQMAFVGAGFFMARADFLVDVPFDPFLPWMFMGEEIALSIRAWTHGWNIYAPRKNLIGHQYRPIKFGTPHYWESVSRLFHLPNIVDRASTMIRQRIKHMMGYPDIIMNQKTNTAHTTDDPSHNISFELEHFGLGQERSREAYLEFAEIDLLKMTCGPMKWCIEGSLE